VFIWLWLGVVVSSVGMWGQTVGAQWLFVNDPNALVPAFTEAVRAGVDGIIDDYLSLTAPWGFDLAEVRCPSTVMVAEDDTTVPPAHGRWLAAHLPTPGLLLVPGGHIAPRDTLLTNLMVSTSGHDSTSTLEPLVARLVTSRVAWPNVGDLAPERLAPIPQTAKALNDQSIWTADQLLCPTRLPRQANEPSGPRKGR
jgi:hypothetical protein